MNYSRLRSQGVGHHDAEDIASINAIKRTFLGKRQALAQTKIDFYRKTYGSDRVQYKKVEDRRIVHETPYDHLLKKETFLANMEKTNHREKCLVRNLLNLKKRKSIARRMQLSPSRLSQLIVDLISKIKSVPLV